MSTRHLLSEHDLFRKPVPIPDRVPGRVRGRLFRDYALKLAAAAAAWIAMAAIAAAQPMPTAADAPTGDVWVTSDAQTPLTAQAQRTPLYRQLPTGDFWPAEGDAVRTADAPAPRRGALAREESATDGAK